MSKPTEREFIFSDGTTHDATVSEISEALESCSNYVWNITPTCESLGGAASYTVEVSNDGVCWFEYADEFTDVDTVDAVEDIQLSFTLIRINYDSGTATVGNVKFTLIQKGKS